MELPVTDHVVTNALLRRRLVFFSFQRAQSQATLVIIIRFQYRIFIVSKFHRSAYVM